MSHLTKFPYKEGGILPDGSRLPDIPTINLLFVRRDRNQVLMASSVVDTGFDASIYSNMVLAELLEGMLPVRIRELEAPGHRIRSELYEVECRLCDSNWKPAVNLGKVDVLVPVEPGDITPDILVGREVLNSLDMRLDGRFLQVVKARR